MFAFTVLERVENVVGPVPFKVNGKHLVLGVVLDDSQMDAVLASVATHIGMVEHTAMSTTLELLS